MSFLLNSFLAGPLSSADNLCKQFGPRSGPDQAQHDVNHNLDPNHLTLRYGVPEIIFRQILILKKVSRRHQKNKKFGEHTGKCIRRFAGIYAYCPYFIERMW